MWKKAGSTCMLHVNVLSLGALLWKTQGRSFWPLGAHFPTTDNQKSLVALTSMIIITPIALWPVSYSVSASFMCACRHFYDSTDFPRCMPYASYTFYFHFCFRATAAPHIITEWLQHDYRSCVHFQPFIYYYYILYCSYMFCYLSVPVCVWLCVIFFLFFSHSIL